ncbi:MAG: hypothetical protein ABR557_14435, partial [Pyrinomonadaceae bacterium]
MHLVLQLIWKEPGTFDATLLTCSQEGGLAPAFSPQLLINMSQPLLSALFDKPERRPLTVSQLTAAVRG